METTVKNTKATLFKKLGFLGIGLCTFLCALPIIGTILGVAAFSTAALYFENIGMFILIISLGLLTLWLIKRGKSSASSCDINCDCKKKKVSE